MATIVGSTNLYLTSYTIILSLSLIRDVFIRDNV
jgi:hypothetical protein